MSKAQFTSVKTTLKPKTYGKRDQRLSNSLKTKATVTLFKSKKPVYKVLPYISASGKLTPVRLTLAHLSDSLTTSNNLASRPVFVSTSLDPRPYETNDNRVVFADSNEQMMLNLKHEQSPYNAFVVTGSFGSANIPFSIDTWDNVEHNKHALDFISKATTVAKATNLTDAVRQKTFDTLYAEYMAKEQELLDKGIIVVNGIIVAKESGIQLMTTIAQNTESRNDFFNSTKVFGNEHSLATYAPMTNEVYGSMKLSGSKAHGNWTYGLNETNGLSSFSAPVNFFDFRNKVDTSEARIVVRDRFRPNEGSNQRTRTQALDEFVQENSVITIYGAQLRLGLTELGGLTSVFSLEGDDLTYTKTLMATQDTTALSDVTADLDSEVKLDTSTMGDFVMTEDTDFLASITSQQDDSEDVPFSTGSEDFVGNTITSDF